DPNKTNKTKQTEQTDITSKEVIGTGAIPTQSTLIDLTKQKEKSHLEKLASKKSMSKKERSELQIGEARLGIRPWEYKNGKGVSNQSFAVYYAIKHEEILGTDSGFNFIGHDYSTTKFFEHFVKRFDIE